MKFSLTSILICLIIFSSCVNEKKQNNILGGWKRTTSDFNMRSPKLPSCFSGYLSSDLLITKDSIFIINEDYFLKSASTYEFFYDSLFIHSEQPIKYKINVTDSSLSLVGKNYYYSHQVNESYQFVKSDYLEIERSRKLISEVLNLHQLMQQNWSVKPNENLEVLSEEKICTFETYDTAMNIFPDTIKFRDSDLQSFDITNFKMEEDTFKIVDFNGLTLILERTYLGKRYRIIYEDCSYLYP